MANKQKQKKLRWWNIALPIITPIVALGIAIPVTWKLTRDQGGGDTPTPTPTVQHTLTYDDGHKDGSTITTSKVKDGELAIMHIPQHHDEQGFLGWKEVKQDESEAAKNAPYFDFRHRTITQDFKLYGWWKYTVDTADEDGKPYFLPEIIEGLTYVKWNFEAKAPDYNNFNLVLPKQLNGQDIVGVAPNGFFDPADYEPIRLNIRSISLPDSIKVFSQKAFAHCHNLMIINFPQQLLSIQPFCFQYCAKLSNLTFNEGLERIEENAFNCNYSDVDQFIKSVTMPSTLKHIGSNAFFYSAVQTLDMSKCGNIDIGINAFNSCWYLKKLILPEKLERIPEGCFFSCNSLEYLSIPQSVISIGANAFDTCSRIEQVTIADDSEMLWIGAYAFARCYCLEKINLPYKLKYIDVEAFAECYALNDVSFANTREWVFALNYTEEYGEITWTPSATNTYANAVMLKNNVWERWTIKPEQLLDAKYNLYYVTNDKNQCYLISYADYIQVTLGQTFYIPAKITNDAGTYDVIGIASDAFAVAFDWEKISEVVFEKDDNGKNYLQYIGDRAFNRNSKIATINLDVCTELQYIGEQAFRFCFKPDEETTPLTIDLSTTKVEYIGYQAFHTWDATNCPVQAIKLPTTLQTLGGGCFDGLQNLTSIDIPEGCELSELQYKLNSEIDPGSYVWYTESIIKETKVSKLDLSHTKLTYIAQGAFQDLTNTTEIVLPEGILEIASKAFSCHSSGGSLTTINIPASCKLIGSKVFENTLLNSATFDDNTSEWSIYDGFNWVTYNVSGQTAAQNATALTSTYPNASWIKK